MLSATLDSSVYIRALHLGGPAASLIGTARVGDLRIDLSEPILKETVGVLRDVFAWDGYSLNDARHKLLGLANVVSPTETLNVIDYDPPDNRILECAVVAKSDFIISEDKDLLRLGSYRGIPITTVHNFLNSERTERGDC